MAEGKILATVAGEAITEIDVEEMLASMGQNAPAYDSPKGRAVILEQLIDRKLILLDAKRNLFERDAEFKEELARVKDELLYNYAIQKAVSGTRVTDDEIKSFYDEHRDDLVSRESIDVSHILVEDEEKCADIKRQIEEGLISFEDAASKYSSCPSRESGGSLGEAARGQFVPEFEDAAFSAEPGVIVGPVKTQFGYHLIRVNSKTPAQNMKFEDVKDQLRVSIMRDKQQKAYQSKIRQLMIMYPVDKF